MKSILGLADWNLTMESLSSLDNAAVAHISLSWPNLELLTSFSPSKRKGLISIHLRQAFAKLKKRLRGMRFLKIGSNHRPTGVNITLPLHLLPELLAAEEVSGIMIYTISGLEQTPENEQEAFWSVKARFACQIEGRIKGMQMYEDRVLLVKAQSDEEAQSKLLPSFKAYATPYLNAKGELVRWQFEEFLETEMLYSPSLDAAANEEGGVEAYSHLRRRKLQPNLVWNPGRD
jgi:hypothetical protein